MENMNLKEQYSVRLENILKKYDLDGGFLNSTYQKGIETENFTSCYIDDRIKNAKKLRKELAILLDSYFEDFPNAKEPLYSYK